MVNRLMYRRILRQLLIVRLLRKSSIKLIVIQKVFWSAVPLPRGIYVAPFICKIISVSVIKVPFQQKTSLPSVVKFNWLGLNVFQYPNKILIVGPKGLQELEFNPQQRLLLRNTGKKEKHLFLLSGPIKRFYVPRGSAYYFIIRIL